MKKQLLLYILLIALAGYGIAITLKYRNAEQEITTLRSQLKMMGEYKHQFEESLFKIDSLQYSK